MISSRRGTNHHLLKKEPQESEQDNVYTQVFFKKTELECYYDYLGNVKEGDTSGGFFTIHQDSIPSEGGDANLAKKRKVHHFIKKKICRVTYTKYFPKFWMIYSYKGSLVIFHLSFVINESNTPQMLMSKACHQQPKKSIELPCIKGNRDSHI